MQRTPACQRQRAKTPRRDQIRRRRAVALAVVVTLIVLAVWAAYAIPGQAPARVPQNAAAALRRRHPSRRRRCHHRSRRRHRLPPARGPRRDHRGGLSLRGQHRRHPVAAGGERPSGGRLGQQLADIFAGGGGPQYYLMDGDRRRASSSTAGLDIGAVPGSPVVSPVDGKVMAIKKYQHPRALRRRRVAYPARSRPVTAPRDHHLAQPQVDIGDVVARGETVLGDVRGFPTALDQALSRYTSDTGDHVQMMVLRVTPELAGL